MVTTNSKLPPKLLNATRFCVISDVHLGHRKTPTYVIIESLYRYVVNPVSMAQLDALLITGDLFDRLLTLPMAEVSAINEFMTKLLRLAAQFKVAIRVLEGTPSHDWRQSKLLVDINENNHIGADLIYVDTLTIMEDPTLNLTIGYIPDEWRSSHEATTQEFIELMATKGYQQIDLLLMHGMFQFQIPANVHIPAFDQTVFAPLVRYHIFIGHDHKYKTWQHITVPGSTERLAQNEENPKGLIIADLVDGAFYSHFVENVEALVYRTLRLEDTPDEEAMPLIEAEISRIAPKGQGYLKIVLPKETNLRQWIKDRQSTTVVQLTLELVNKVEAQIIENDEFMLKTNQIYITADNISTMIMEELMDKIDDHPILQEEIAFIQGMM